MTDTPKQLRATPPQVATLAILEHCIGILSLSETQLKHTAPVASALKDARLVLEKAHEAFVDSLSSTISIAAPSELAEAVKSLVQAP